MLYVHICLVILFIDFNLFVLFYALFFEQIYANVCNRAYRIRFAARMPVVTARIAVYYNFLHFIPHFQLVFD